MAKKDKQTKVSPRSYLGGMMDKAASTLMKHKQRMQDETDRALGVKRKSTNKVKN